MNDIPFIVVGVVVLLAAIVNLFTGDKEQAAFVLISYGFTVLVIYPLVASIDFGAVGSSIVDTVSSISLSSVLGAASLVANIMVAIALVAIAVFLHRAS